MARSRRPLRAVSLVFVGFVTLVVLSQISVHFFSTAIPKNLKSQDEAIFTNIEQTSIGLALAASLLGLVFAGAVLIITRTILTADVDIYRAMGLPPSSAFVGLVRSHSLRPLGWVSGTAVVTALIDTELGLNPLLPVGLAIAFVVLLIGWLGFITSVSFSHQMLAGSSSGRTG